MTRPTQLLNHLTSLGASISLSGDELLVNAPRDVMTAELRSDLLEHKPAIVAILKMADMRTPVVDHPSNGREFLSHAQQRIWFLDQMEPESAVWNVASVFSIAGRVDVDALERALLEIVSRHAVLRSTFDSLDGVPFARIGPSSDWRLTKQLTNEADALLQAQAAAMKPIDLKAGPLFRAVLLEAAPDKHYLILAIHHIVCDGWSLGLLSRELSLLYSAFVLGENSPLPALRYRYAHFVDWERTASARVSDTDVDWWRNRLAGPLPALELGVQGRPPSIPRHEGRRISLAVPKLDAACLHLLARECGATSFMLLLAAFKVLLYRYTGAEDIVIGTVSSYRKRREFEQLVGMFANPVVLRTSLSGNPSFREVLDRVRETVVSAFSHDTMPFDRLIEELHPDRDANRPPLFQVSFAYQNLPPAQLLLEGVRVQQQPVAIPHARYDLSVEIWTTDSGMTCDFEFRTGLFDVAAIGRMQAHYLGILRAVLADAQFTIFDLDLLSNSERTTLTTASNGARTSYPEQPVHALFEVQCDRNPGAAALIDGQRTVSYGELNAQADALAVELKARGAGAGTSVAILIDRSAESVVAMLAILKSGGVYLVLDTEYPEERLRFLLQDAGAKIVLINSAAGAGKEHWPAGFNCLDIASIILSPLTSGLDYSYIETTLDDPMCLLYTSGSTGTPKGVEMCHRGLVRLLYSSECRSFGSGEAVLHMAPESFDASLLEIWGPLVHGGCSVICRERHPSLPALKALIEQNHVCAAWITSSLLNWIVDQAPDTLESLERIYTGGEALSVPHIRRAYEALPSVTIFNGYGPTEATVFTCLYAIPRSLPEDLISIPIGRPISNTSAYVLDGNRQLLPAGIPGELYIGGDALALGYRNRHDLNAERFLPDPFTEGARLYRSGDRCAYLPDGNLDFIGRLDSQVKIRGHRIEPGEIEAAIERHTGVSSCAVTSRKDAQRGDILVAWFNGDLDVRAKELRNMLKSTFPAYMVPNLLLRLTDLPLLENGKVDRAALNVRPLPETAPADLPATPARGFERDIVQLIAQSMAELLGIEHVRHDDDFFALGGHSLLAMQLLARIESLLGQRISPSLLFRSATPETIARFLEDRAACHPQRLLPLRSSGTQPPIFCIHVLLDGSIHNYLALVRCLDHSRPVYGLCPGEFDLERKRFWTLDEIAAEYILEVKRVRPSGPYNLCGYSSAGILAFEMARQLRREGYPVNLFLLDSFPPTTLQNLSAVEMFKMVRVFVRSRGRRHIVSRLLLRLRRDLREKMTAFLERLFDRPEPEIKDHDKALVAMLNRAMNQHRSRVCSGHAVLFKAQQEGRHRRLNFDGCNNWLRLVRGGVELRLIPGDHHQIMQHPSVELLAEQLQECLRQE